MKIAVIGTGYVGLVTGTCFAEMGNTVICVDIDVTKIEKLRFGTLPIFEPGLESLLERNLREQRLTFTTELTDAVAASEIIFLALPTPSGADGAADISAVLKVSHEIGRLLTDQRLQQSGLYKVIVNKSTVPVGTADRVREAMAAQGLTPGLDFDVVSNPEFLREGKAVEDFLKPERVVVGTSNTRAAELMTSLYEPFVRNGNPIFVMDERSAEMTKYAANAYLATRISFMNEIANLCTRVGATVDQVRRAMGADSRIGNQFLYSGIGFGGSCFPKDVQAIGRTAADHGYEFKIVNAVCQVNQVQYLQLVTPVMEYFGPSLAGRHFAVWGLAFKPNTDDVREAPAHAVIRALLAQGATITAFDPEAMETSRQVLGESIKYASSTYEALEGADALIICTEWAEFRQPDFPRMHELLRQPVIFDGRNLYQPVKMMELEFQYFSIGRPQAARKASSATSLSFYGGSLQ